MREQCSFSIVGGQDAAEQNLTANAQFAVPRSCCFVNSALECWFITSHEIVGTNIDLHIQATTQPINSQPRRGVTVCSCHRNKKTCITAVSGSAT